jgi:phage shock protein B
MEVDVLAVFMVFAIPLVAIIGGIFIAALKILKGDSKRKSSSGDLNGDEALLIQEIHSGLADLERRVESLETLLLAKVRGE